MLVIVDGLFYCDILMSDGKLDGKVRDHHPPQARTVARDALINWFRTFASAVCPSFSNF
jgi:hypothetical protein